MRWVSLHSILSGIFLLGVITFWSSNVAGQNLVPNPSFEAGTAKCDPNIAPKTLYQLATFWYCPQEGTTDVYSTTIVTKSCYSSMPYNGTDGTHFHVGTQNPRTGNKFIGLFTFSAEAGNPNYREYAAIKLTQPLTVGKYYCAKAYVSRAEFIRYASTLDIYIGDTVDIPGVGTSYLSVQPLIKSKVITESNLWEEISGTFQATSPAQHIIIGNFSSDAQTMVQNVGIMGGNARPGNLDHAYYFIDDVSVEEVPNKILFAGSQSVCSNELTNVSVVNAFDFITWAPATDTLQIVATGKSLNIFQLQKTKYLVKAFGCGRTLRDTITIDTRPSPQVNLGKDTTICAGTSLQLDAGPEGITYQWQDNSTNRYLLATKSNSYSVKVSNQFNCHRNDQVNVTVRNPPVAALGSDTLVCGSFPVLEVSNGNNYLWSTGSTLPSIFPSQPGSYWVRIENQCGVSRDTIKIFSIDDLFIPNVITLNNDSYNERFKFGGIGNNYAASLIIVDRDGFEIFSDPSYGGQWPSPANQPNAGTFYYLVSFSGCRTYKGWLEIIR